MKKSKVKTRNPIAQIVKSIKPTIVLAKKGKGSYNRNKEKVVKFYVNTLRRKNQCMSIEQPLSKLWMATQ